MPATTSRYPHPRLPYGIHLATGVVIGLIAARRLLADHPIAALLLGITLLVPIGLGLRRPGRWVLGWLLIGVALGGARGVCDEVHRRAPDHLSVHLPSWPHRIDVSVRGCVSLGTHSTADGWSARLQVHAIRARSEAFQTTRGGLRLSWQSDSLRPVTGDCLELRGRLGASAPSASPFGWRSAAADRLAGVSGSLLLAESGKRPLWLAARVGLGAEMLGSIERLRLQRERAVVDLDGGRGTAWVLALGAGVRGHLEDPDRAVMARSGMAHLLAVSGLHLALFVLGLRRSLEWLWRRAGVLAWYLPARLLGAAVTLPLCWSLVIFTGRSTATVRGAIFLSCLALGELLGRRARLSGALGAAATILLMMNPAELTSVSFQLSATAVIGIGLAAAWFRARPRAGWRGRVVRALRLSIAISLTTAPVLAWHFGVVSLSGVLLNVLLAPVLALILIPAAGLALVLVDVYPDGARAACWMAQRVVEIALPLADAVSRSLGDPWVVGRPSGIEAAVFLLLVALWAAAGQQPRLRRAARRTALLLVPVLLVCAWCRLAPPAQLEAWFLPVGQGDATLLRLPSGHHVLVDAGGRWRGPDPGRTVVVPTLHGLGVQRLDLVVLSHGDVDHIGGLAAVVAAYPPREIWWRSEMGAEPELRRLARELAEQGTVVREIEAAGRRTFRLGRSQLEILTPRPDPTSAPLRGNDASIILSVQHDGRRILLLGDIEAPAEERLVAHSPGSLRADLVKVPHHGSLTSSSPSLLAEILPTVAVVSAGAGNRFGHPHPEVVDRYRSFGARLLRTDRDGLIVVRLRRRGLSIRTWRRPP